MIILRVLRCGCHRKRTIHGVEYLFPYEWPAADLAKWLDAAGLQQVLFNAPPGEWERNERGTAALPGRQEEFRAGIRRALEYAAALHCPRIHVMAGLVPPNGDRAEMRATYLANLRWACDEAHRAGRKLLLEPINTRDIPGFFLNRQDEAHAVVAEVGSASLQVQMDLYHCQIVEGDLATKIRRYVPTGNVGHIQVAGVPDHSHVRADTGDLLDRLDSLLAGDLAALSNKTHGMPGGPVSDKPLKGE